MAYKNALNMLDRGIRYYNQANQVYKTFKPKSRPRTNSSKKPSSISNTTTNQHDFTRQYRYKRMPKYRRRRWKKFVRKVRAAIETASETKVHLINELATSLSGAGTQQWHSCMLYGNNGADVLNQTLGSEDLLRITNAQFGTADSRSYKINFKSAVLDWSLTNTGTTSLEVDLYHVVFNHNDLSASLAASVTSAEDTTATLSGGTSLELSDRGATLFDFPTLTSRTKMKILKKLKFFISPQQTITHQLRDPKNHAFSTSQTKINAQGTTNQGWIMPKMTQGLVAVYKTTAGNQGTAGSVAIGCTRNYKYHVIDTTGAQDTSSS